MVNYRNTWANIKLTKLVYNIQNLINYNSDYEYYFGVVKANAYSHGDIMVSKQIIKHGINYLAVSSLDEAINIRKHIKRIPILCLEPVDMEFVKIAQLKNITITITNLDEAKYISDNISSNIKIHIKVDTGMNRLGFKNKAELEESISLLQKNNIILEGLYTHMATSDTDESFYNKQIDNFKKITKNIDLSIFKIIHVGNSGAFLNYKKPDFVNGVRFGLCMYGINTTNKNINLIPVLELKSKIIELKDLKENEGLGYGLKYVSKEDEKIAIVPIGYADGILKNNTGRNVIINNKSYKIVGNICMDMLFIKVDKDVKLNDTVTLIGDNVGAKYIADYLDTIPYEVLCNISDRVTRYYYLEDKIIGNENRRNG